MNSIETMILDAVLSARLRDPFAVLGAHVQNGICVWRYFDASARDVAVIDAASGMTLTVLEPSNAIGYFVGSAALTDASVTVDPYRYRVSREDGVVEIEDPYRFGPVLGEMDRYLLAEGTHLRAYEILGAHVGTQEDVSGVGFAVWAPNAHNVSVIGDFNDWDGRCHPMRFHPGCGIWDLFVPGVKPGAAYKFEIHTADGTRLPLKADPWAAEAERPSRTASVVAAPSSHIWRDADWMASRAARQSHRAPMSIYEVHLGSWRRRWSDGGFFSWAELAAELVPYVTEMGFTHIEVLPLSEFPFDGSWGYQPIGLAAPTSRFGTPDEFRAFVDACHAAGIGLLVDFVPAHFPTDEHGLAQFDGTALYEHADPREGFHHDWNTLIYNFGRREVTNYLIGAALSWFDRFHIDGLRVDAVASMLYRDYSRKPGEWVPNADGGRENWEAVSFLRRFNQAVFQLAPGATTAAEESTSWPDVSRPTDQGGLGFGFKWNMGWMHDTLNYMGRDPIHRGHHQHELTFGLLYAFSENFILPLSHDEVVHGKGSLLTRMPGDEWQKFANLRAYFGFMWGHPGKKLIFMGCEFAQRREWDHDHALDWFLLDAPLHRGVQSLIRDLNRLYVGEPALHRLDADPAGFSWVDASDSGNSVLSFLRRGEGEGQLALVVCNFTPVPRAGYRIGVPVGGVWVERINTDAAIYGGSNMGNFGEVHAEASAWQGQPASIVLTLPPLSTLILTLKLPAR